MRRTRSEPDDTEGENGSNDEEMDNEQSPPTGESAEVNPPQPARPVRGSGRPTLSKAYEGRKQGSRGRHPSG